MTQRFSKGWHNHGQPRKRGKSMGTLYYSTTHDDGEVMFNLSFDDHAPLTQLDMLQDWIGLLNREYDEIFKATFGEQEERALQ